MIKQITSKQVICKYWKGGDSGYYYCHHPDWDGHKYGCYYRYAGFEPCPNYKRGGKR